MTNSNLERIAKVRTSKKIVIGSDSDTGEDVSITVYAVTVKQRNEFLRILNDGDGKDEAKALAYFASVATEELKGVDVDEILEHVTIDTLTAIGTAIGEASGITEKK